MINNSKRWLAGLAEIKETLKELKHRPTPESKGKEKMPMKKETKK